jgi:hypothetical protein
MRIRQMQSNLGSTMFYTGLGAAAGATVSLLGMGMARSLPAVMPSMSGGVASQLHVMGLPLSSDTQAYWYLARAGGILAYLLLWFGSLWGVLMSTKLAKGLYVFGLHEYLPILAMIFATLHALVLLGDHYIGFDLLQLALPFTASYRPLWTGLGTLALYLGIALAASFYVRQWIGRRTWRVLHYATYAVFALAITHGLMAGTDSTLPAVRWIYIATGAALLLVTLMRIFSIGAGRSAGRSQLNATGSITRAR